MGAGRSGGRVIELDPSSWVDVVRGLVPRADEVHDELVATVPWQPSRVFRYERWIDEPRLFCWQSGSGRHPALVETQAWISSEVLITGDGSEDVSVETASTQNGNGKVEYTADFVLLKPADAQFLVSTAKFEPQRVIDVFAGSGPRSSSEVDTFFSAAGLSVRYFPPGTAARLAR